MVLPSKAVVPIPRPHPTVADPCLRPPSPLRNGMENSRLPIEICERIMDTLFNSAIRKLKSRHDALHTLPVCALTCWAWHHPALRCVSPSFASNIRALVLGGSFEEFSLSRPGNLFLLSLPNLQNLRLSNLDLGATPISVPPRLRNSLPLCANVTRLRLTSCTFNKLRSMLDIIWSCSHLQCLRINYCNFTLIPSQDEQSRLAQACRNIKACRSLTCLALTVAPLPKFAEQFIHIPEGTLGSALTTLVLMSYLIYPEGLLVSNNLIPPLLNHPFPHLHTVVLRIDLDWRNPWYNIGTHILSRENLVKLSTVRTLQRLYIKTVHTRSARCCWAIFGAINDAVPEDQTLRLLFPNLVSLQVRFWSRDNNYDPERCARKAIWWSYRRGQRSLRRQWNHPLGRQQLKRRPRAVPSSRDDFRKGETQESGPRPC
ncbi:hypothetical protein OH77DRAFT_647881 [Trametes cingulata]|nr:hypothetical protein OH77DRAFT_647881 [Trametes cingulata]